MADEIERDEPIEAPDRLIKALSELSQPPQSVSAQTDEAVMAMARAKLRRRGRIVILQRYVAYAAAAALAIVFGSAMIVGHNNRVAARVANAANPMNVNGDAKVDILDAFALARKIETKQAPAAKYDFNADKTVDEKDVRMIAMAVVKLRGEAVK